ncbi:MAG: DUF4424 domain-containing protein [Hyphomicrobiaceae bacterium]|nr:DUF4424 domain-containing protein [Hyphomicrobiaceae bacterium]MCC0024851.1 DUF4424 domain-containing protein [Hyphomicrobiaceae bacterium]
MRRLITLLVAGLPGLLAGPAIANDSIAEIGAGGIQYVYADGIQMVREDLSISTEEVTVDYVFHNWGDSDQTVMVAFPMPDITVNYEEEVSVPFWDDDNFLGFHVTVGGQEIVPQLQQRASLVGVDITRDLQKLGIPLLNVGTHVLDVLDGLDRATLQELGARGIVYLGEFYSGPDKTVQAFPNWTLQSVYYWTMTFPAGRDAHVSHRYTPAVGASAGTGLDFAGGVNSEWNKYYADKYCIDDSILRGAQNRMDGGDYLYEQRISYILTTGRNWYQTIGTFHLTVDKGSPENLVSWCGTGIKKTGPTTFEVTIEDFYPERDLDVLLLSVPGNG